MNYSKILYSVGTVQSVIRKIRDVLRIQIWSF